MREILRRIPELFIIVSALFVGLKLITLGEQLISCILLMILIHLRDNKSKI